MGSVTNQETPATGRTTHSRAARQIMTVRNSTAPARDRIELTALRPANQRALEEALLDPSFSFAPGTSS
jgi:hypothetical protein